MGHASTARRWHFKPRPTVFTDTPGTPSAGVITFSREPIVRGDALALAERIGGTAYLSGHHPVIKADAAVYVTEAATWFGQTLVTETTAAQLAGVWQWLERQVRTIWHDPRIQLLATPGTTGRDLWLRSLDDDTWPCVSDEVAQLIHSTAGQARVELRPPAVKRMPELVEYDMRLAYAAVARSLPAGEPAHLRWRGTPTDDQLRMPARWLVRFRPPTGWGRRPGILPLAVEGGGWSWPTQRRWHGPTWADGCEVAIACAQGWEVDAYEVLVWPERGDPLRTWCTRLLSIIDRAQAKLPALDARLVRSAVRAMILHTIGAMFGAPYRVDRHADADDVPADAESIVLNDDGTVSWTEYQQTRWPETMHPEWSAHIWARTRARLLSGPRSTGALNVTSPQLVAFRTDAVYFTGATDWDAHDTGQPGQWTRKRHAVGPLPWPSSHTELLQLRGA